jgi:hypothetical protein
MFRNCMEHIGNTKTQKILKPFGQSVSTRRTAVRQTFFSNSKETIASQATGRFFFELRIEKGLTKHFETECTTARSSSPLCDLNSCKTKFAM